jgi:uncharacterized protein (DUF849 family)
LQEKTKVLRENLTPMPCPPKILHDLAWDLAKARSIATMVHYHIRDENGKEMQDLVVQNYYW